MKDNLKKNMKDVDNEELKSTIKILNDWCDLNSKTEESENNVKITYEDYRYLDYEFKPAIPLAEMYSLENLAKRRGTTVEELKQEMEELSKQKQNIIDEKIKDGWTKEQAETHAMRCLYIPGFSGKTFND